MRQFCTLTIGLALTACTPDDTEHRFTFTMSNISAPGDLPDQTGEKHNIAFAPGLLIVHSPDLVLFEPGQASLWPGLQDMTEDGNNAPLIRDLQNHASVAYIASYANQDEDYKDTPLEPGASVEHTLVAEPGSLLTFVTMFGQSNDIFVATSAPVTLFDDEESPLVGDLAAHMALFDGGTELNEEPGVGPNQAPRQPLPNTGPDENGVVTIVDGTDAEGYSYPQVSEMLTLSSQHEAVIIELESR